MSLKNSEELRDEFDGLLRKAFGDPPDPQILARLEASALQEQERVASEKQAASFELEPEPSVSTGRRRFPWPASGAAAALLLSALLWYLSESGTPVPRQPEASRVETAPVARRVRPPEELVGMAVEELSRTAKHRLGREARSWARRLGVHADRASRLLRADPLPVARLLLFQLDREAARESLLSGIDRKEDVARAMALIFEEGGRLGRSWLRTQVSSPKIGVEAWVVIHHQSPALAGEMLWQEWRRRGSAEFGEFFQVIIRRMDRAAISKLASDLPPAADHLLIDLVAETEDPKTWPILDAILERTGPQPSLLAAAGRIRAPEATGLLRPFLGYADGRAQLAIQGLSRIDHREAAEALFLAFSGLDGSISSPERRSALAAALQFQGKTAVEALTHRVREGPHNRVAIRALVELFPREAATVLPESLAASRGDAQDDLLVGLGQLGDPATAQSVIPFLCTNHRRLARKALIAMAGFDLGPHPRAWFEWWSRLRQQSFEKSSLPASKETV